MKAEGTRILGQQHSYNFSAMRVLNILGSVLLPAISLCAQVPPQKPAAKSEGTLFQEIRFVGVRQVPLAALRKVAADYEGKQFDAVKISELEERVRDLYQQYGFFKALITRDDSATGGSQIRPTPLVYKVEEGRRYRLGTIRFENAKAFAPGVLRPLFPIVGGEIYNVAKVRKGLENLRSLYGTRGYINFTPVPDTLVDDDAATVSLVIDLDEGKPFRVATVKIFGLDWNRSTQLLCGWPLKPGAVYATDVLERFFFKNRALLPPGSRPEINTEILRNEESATVDISLNFSSSRAPIVEVEARPEIVITGEKPPKR
jgi:outer membrane protein assembly factor BamA